MKIFKLFIYIILLRYVFPKYAYGDVPFEAGLVIEGDLVIGLKKFILDEARSISLIDFNNDGIPEKVVEYLCGNAGCENYIFKAVSENQHIFLGEIFIIAKRLKLLMLAKENMVMF